MKVQVEFQGQQKYLPNSRCSHKRTRIYYDTHEVEVKEVTEMPIAFKVTDYATIYPAEGEKIDVALGTELTEDFHKGNEYLFEAPYYAVSGFIITDIGYVDGRFYKKMRASRFREHAAGPCGTEYLEKCIRCDGRMIGYNCHPDMPFVEGKSKVIWDSRFEQFRELENEAEGYLIYNGEIWEECGEPMYYCITFGLGHNHASTVLATTFRYNENISKESYFRADQLSEAIEYTCKVASDRGDTNSLEYIRYGKNRIQILIPEAVSRNPEEEHGDGNVLHKMLYGLTEKASSATEAAALVVSAAISKIV